MSPVAGPRACLTALRSHASLGYWSRQSGAPFGAIAQPDRCAYPTQIAEYTLSLDTGDKRPALFDRLSGDDRRLSAGDQPAGGHCDEGYADEDYEEVGDRDVAERRESVVASAIEHPADDPNVAGRSAEEGPCQPKCARSRRGDRPASPAARPARGQGAQIARSLASDQPDASSRGCTVRERCRRPWPNR